MGERGEGTAEMEALRERQDAGRPHGAESQNHMEQKHRQKAGKRTGTHQYILFQLISPSVGSKTLGSTR